MKLGLKTKCLLLVLPLVAVSLLLLANTTSSRWTLQEHVADFRTAARQSELAGAFAVAAARQIKETLDIAFGGEEEDEFKNAQRTAQETLASWIRLVSREDDPHARQKLDDLLEIEHLYFAAQPIMQEIIDLGRRGDRESAMEVVARKLESLADRNLFVKTDTRLRAEDDELATALHDVIGATGHVHLVGDDTTNHMEEIETDYRRTLLARRFLLFLNRQVAEYSSIVLTDEKTDELRFVQRQAELTLRDWLAVSTGESREGELHALRVIEDQFAQLGSLGNEVLHLVEQGKREDAWRRLARDMEQLVDEGLIPLVAKQLSAEEIELAEGMDRLSEHATSATRFAVVVAVFVVLLGIATPWLLARKIVKPIVHLTEATEKIGAGRLERRVDISSHDEIGMLAATFNGMADRLQKSQEELEQRVCARTAELERALKSSQAATTAKSEFLANMSHEIRTPMTAILGFAENLLDSDQSESEKLECIHTIRRNGECLQDIINDILDLSKVESGKLDAVRASCEPCTLIAEVCSLVRVQADAKGLPFHIEYDGAIPKTIHTDAVRLRQILINLIGNAIKFTEAGAVRLVTRFVDDTENDRGGSPKEPRLQFDVIDTGCGIPEEVKESLFQPFMQVDTSATRKIGGTGLGLTISKRFAEQLGGDITVVETELGVGSTFRATVATGSLDGVKMLEDPLSETAVAEDANTVARPPRPDLHGLRILLAEDGPDNQRLILLRLGLIRWLQKSRRLQKTSDSASNNTSDHETSTAS